MVQECDLTQENIVEEENKINENKKKYKKNNQAPPDIKIPITMKRIVKEITLKANDPLITTSYNKYFGTDKIDQKKYLTDIEICKVFQQKYKKGVFPHKKLIQMQQ